MKKIKLLIVEDNSIDKRLIEEYLVDLPDVEFECTHAFRLKEAFNLLNSCDFDIVTLDLGLPDSHGLETFERFQAAFPDMPTIVISGYEDQTLARAVTKAGAHGYIVKGNFDQDSLLKEIKLAINKQTFRDRVAKKIFFRTHKIGKQDEILQSSGEELTIDEKQITQTLLEREPEIFQELVEEYIKLIPLSIETELQVKANIQDYYIRHQEAFNMLHLTQADVEAIHKAALDRLTFVDKSNPNFSILAALVFQEASRLFKAKTTT